MNPTDILQLISKGERVTLECKKAQNGLPNSLWETYSAFANTHGGTILLGVVEDVSATDPAKRFSITGVDDADKLCKDIWNTINSREKVNVNLLGNDDVQVVDIDGKNVIAIHVSRADYTIRPVFINSNPLKGSYKRNHEGDYHCTEQELRMMMRDANEAGNDRMFLEYYTMDDIDIPTLERYRIMFKTDNPEHVWNELDHKDFLMQLGGYVVNRKEQTEGLTMAGLLMFGKGLPIRDRFDNLRMDYIDKSNLIGDQRYSDRITYDGTWENNLYNFIRMVIPRLTRDLPRPFNMEGIIRKDDTPQHKAVREALTNAIIHADFMLNGILKVEKYDDRFVLTNPGLLKLPIEQIYAGGESKARNQRMQAMLRMIGYGENLGSGFPLILNAWNEKHWLKPELFEQPELLQVKLVLKIVDLEKEGLVTQNVTKDVTKNVTKDDENVTKDVIKDDTKDDTKELSDRQEVMMLLIQKDDTITIKELSQKTNSSEVTIKRELAALQAKGILTREGGRKGGHWVIKQNKMD